MSRSIHKTRKRVFGGKSKEEVRKMIEEGDPDVEDLAKKKSYKRRKKRQRRLSNGDTYSGAKVSCSEEIWAKIKQSLEQEKYKWRTISGVSRDTNLSPEQITICLALHESEVIKSSLPSKLGSSLYTTRENYRKKSTIWARLESSILNRVVS